MRVVHRSPWVTLPSTSLRFPFMPTCPPLRPLMFTLPTETAHALALAALNRAPSPRPTRAPTPHPLSSVTLMGLHFPNRVGLAAGFDKNARYIDALGSLGFGF